MERAERDAAMQELRDQGMTLCEIGKRFGVSRERVRQCVKHLPASEAGDLRRAREVARAELLAEELYEAYDEGLDRLDLARHFGLTRDAVTAVLAKRGDLARHQHWAKVHKRNSIMYSDAYLLSALADAAAEIGATPSVKWWNSHRDPERPSVTLYGNRFGSWAAACLAAGLAPNASPRKSYTRAWSEADLLGWVQRYTDELGELPGYVGYTQWAARTEGAPSGARIRQMLGSWITVLERIELP